jgi:hypothetical protein
VEKYGAVYEKIWKNMVPFMRDCGKIFTVGQATDDNMAHVHTHTHTEKM